MRHRKPSLAPPDSLILTRHESAALVRMHVSHIDRAIKREELPAFRPDGSRKVLIFREELIKWLRSAPIWKAVQQ